MLVLGGEGVRMCACLCVCWETPALGWEEFVTIFSVTGICPVGSEATAELQGHVRHLFYFVSCLNFHVKIPHNELKRRRQNGRPTSAAQLL